MKKLTITEAELKKALLIKKRVYVKQLCFIIMLIILIAIMLILYDFCIGIGIGMNIIRIQITMMKKLKAITTIFKN